MRITPIKYAVISAIILLLGFAAGSNAQGPYSAQILRAFKAYGFSAPKVLSTATSVTTTGDITSGGNVIAAATGNISFTTRDAFRSSGNGLLQFGQNAGTTPASEFNTGTAAPTVTACGTGAVTAKSTNLAGEVTPTGASACTVTFGAPAFTNTPFCVVTMETIAEAVRVSAISVTAFTATFTTAANKFMYACIGGI